MIFALICLIIIKFVAAQDEIHICGIYPFTYFSLIPCDYLPPPTPSRDQSPFCGNGGFSLQKRCSTIADCVYSTDRGPIIGVCHEGLCCSPPQICPNGWPEVSDFRCFSDSECNILDEDVRLSGVCRQNRCCFQQRVKGCGADERNTGHRCLDGNECGRAALWAMSSCRNGFCCEKPIFDSPKCSGGGKPIAQQCSHDTQCWPLRQSPSQKVTCENGHCCIAECLNGGKPTGRECSLNNDVCLHLSEGSMIAGICSNGVCCTAVPQPPPIPFVPIAPNSFNPEPSDPTFIPNNIPTLL